jgi:hypothetical protein
MSKTQEEIQALKDNWVKDPCWDIETTEEFEEHHEELLKFRVEQELAWQIEVEEKIERRARVVEIDTGVTQSGAAQSISTYEEIEKMIEHGNVDIAQVHAIMLLAAQVQRIANRLDI